jgi:uncharacterized membrane protein YfcA
MAAAISSIIRESAIAADANSALGIMWPRLAVVGLTAGLFATLFGVGGGIVMVPLLTLLLGFDTKVATATSLAAIIVTATVGVVTYGALGNIAWGYALLIGLPAVVGVLAGLWIKDRITTRELTYAFAGLLAIVALWLVLKPADTDAGITLDMARGLAVAGLGFVAGGLAGLFGVGGGILFVPALALIVGVPQLRAEGASLLAIIPVSLVGSWRQHRAGTVRWGAAMVMGAASVPMAIAGALIADATPSKVLRILFAALLVATAVQLVVRARRTPPRAG